MPSACSRRDLTLIALSCFLLRLPALVWGRFYDPDEAAIAVQARTVVAGGRLYVDMADRKPPIPPLLYAAWFHLTSSNDLRGMRFLVSALLAVAAIVLTLDVCRTHGRAVALWAGALYVFGAFALSPTDAAAANYAHFALPFATIALVYLRRGGWWVAPGGVAFGLAILCRQSWIFAIPAAALSVWIAAAHIRRSRIVSLVMLGAASAATVATAALMAPWSEYWFWNFKSSPGFVFASIGIGTAITRGLAATGLFLLGHLAMTAGAARSLPRTLRTQPDLWLWTLMGLAASAAGFRFYGHYWLQVVPPLTLLAAPVVAAWTGKWRTAAIATLALGVVVCTVVMMSIPTLVRQRHDATTLAADIRSCTATTDRMFIWGSFPELYVLSDRPAAGTLVHSDFVTGRSGGRNGGTDAATPGAQDKMMTDLRRDPPTLLVDTAGVDDLGYGAFPMTGNAELAQFAHEGYTEQKGKNGFVFWWRQGHAPCAATADGAKG